MNNNEVKSFEMVRHLSRCSALCWCETSWRWGRAWYCFCDVDVDCNWMSCIELVWHVSKSYAIWWHMLTIWLWECACAVVRFWMHRAGVWIGDAPETGLRICAVERFGHVSSSIFIWECVWLVWLMLFNINVNTFDIFNTFSIWCTDVLICLI